MMNDVQSSATNEKSQLPCFGVPLLVVCFLSLVVFLPACDFWTLEGPEISTGDSDADMFNSEDEETPDAIARIVSIEGTGLQRSINLLEEDRSKWENYSGSRQAATRRVSSDDPTLVISFENVEDVEYISAEDEEYGGKIVFSFEEDDKSIVREGEKTMLTIQAKFGHITGKIAAGLFFLTAVTTAGYVEAKVFFLQGESPEPEVESPGENCTYGGIKFPKKDGGYEYVCKGDKGEPGDATSFATCANGSCTVNKDLKVEGQISITEDPDCPPSYERVDDATIPATEYYCRKWVNDGEDNQVGTEDDGFDEMVKVGDFWIDRYEATVWEKADCSGIIYGTNELTDADQMNDVGFINNGNYQVKLFACSITGELPTRYATWFQAQQSCALSGKRLCSNAEWQLAVSGTPDPGSWPDSDPVGGCTQGPSVNSGQQCVTCGNGPRSTGSSWSGLFSTSCMSNWGAFDMIGGLGEWVDLWGQYGLPWMTENEHNNTILPWPEDYFSDLTGSINGSTFENRNGMPASLIRGGYYTNGENAGAFFVLADNGPSDSGCYTGFRCCRR